MGSAWLKLINFVGVGIPPAFGAPLYKILETIVAGTANHDQIFFDQISGFLWKNSKLGVATVEVCFDVVSILRPIIFFILMQFWQKLYQIIG